jgi:hypothetical protein
MTDEVNLTEPIPEIVPCDTCAISTLRSRPHSSHIQPGESPLDLIHSDVLGPFKPGLDGSRFIVTFLCDATQLSAAYCIKSKGEVFDCFKHFKLQYERLDRKIHRLRADNGGEYSSKDFLRYLFKNGIIPEFTVPGNPQQNGAAEKFGHVLWNRAKTFLKLSRLPWSYWPEMVRTANYVRLRTPHSRLRTTPFRSWHGRDPHWKHLRTPGTKCWALERLRSKQTDNAVECRLLGYEGDHIYRLLTTTGRVIRASTVQFAQEKRSLEDVGDAEVPPNKRWCDHTVPESWGDDDYEMIQVTHDATNNMTRTGETPMSTPQNELIQPVRESRPRAAKTIQYHPLERALLAEDDENDEHNEPLQFIALIASADPLEPYEPRTYRQAVGGGDAKQWEQSMEEEVNSLKENNTWTLVNRPNDRAVLTGKWVYKHKRGPNGEILRYKSRWVVRGFEQREGLDYNDTFATVVKPMSYKLLFAIAAANDLEIEQMDVKTAFLYGDIDVEVYVEQPEGFGEIGKSDKVCKLNKALYGLKQSPRVWYFTLTNYLKTLGFEPLTADNCIFYDGKSTYIAVFVDDLLIIGPSKPDIDGIKRKLSERFHMTDLGPCRYYLGMEVIRDRPNRTIKLSQRSYLERVLRDFDMWECNKKHDTPIDMHTKLQKAAPGYEPKLAEVKWYQRAVGSLMYAMLGTRPDIAYAVSVVSRYAAKPTPTHKAAVTRILRYLRKTIDYALVFKGELAVLTGYSDSDWAGDYDTRKSTSGYVFSVGSATISWSSKLQATVALSTCEAEYIGQTNATKEAVWLRRLLNEVQPETTNEARATIIYCDNQGAIALAKDPQFHARTKHIDMQHHFVREKVSDGTIQLEYVDTENQVADGLTKALDKIKFERFRKAIGLEPV